MLWSWLRGFLKNAPGVSGWAGMCVSPWLTRSTRASSLLPVLQPEKGMRREKSAFPDWAVAHNVLLWLWSGQTTTVKIYETLLLLECVYHPEWSLELLFSPFFDALLTCVEIQIILGTEWWIVTVYYIHIYVRWLNFFFNSVRANLVWLQCWFSQKHAKKSPSTKSFVGLPIGASSIQIHVFLFIIFLSAELVLSLSYLSSSHLIFFSFSQLTLPLFFTLQLSLFMSFNWCYPEVTGWKSYCSSFVWLKICKTDLRK